MNGPSPSPKYGKISIRVIAIAFDRCVLYYRSPMYPVVPCSSLSSKLSEKVGDFNSTYIYSVEGADIQRQGSILAWIVILSVYGADTIAIDLSLSALIS